MVWSWGTSWWHQWGKLFGLKWSQDDFLEEKKTSFANRDNFPNYLKRWRNHQSVSFFVWLCLQLIQITAKYNLCVLVFCHLPTCTIGTNQPHWYISAPKGKTNPTMRDLVHGNSYHQWPIVLVSNSLILIWVTPFATMHVPAHYPTQTRGQIRSTPFNASVKISQHTCPYQFQWKVVSTSTVQCNVSSPTSSFCICWIKHGSHYSLLCRWKLESVSAASSNAQRYFCNQPNIKTFKRPIKL